MTTIFNPDERLKAADPVDEARLSQPWESVAARRMFEKITGLAYSPEPVPVRRRHWRVYAAGLSAAVAIGCGVAYAVIVRQPTVRLAVACYAQPQLAGRAIQLTSVGKDPVAQCRQEWDAGHVVRRTTTAPDLVACVLRTGPVGVFPQAPGDDVCQRLGLARYDSTPSNPVDRVAAMRDAVVTGLHHSCMDIAHAEALVRRALQSQGLTDWTVTVASPLTPDRPCASPGFDEPGHRVLLIPNTVG